MIFGYKFHKKTYVLKAIESAPINIALNGLLDKNGCYDAITKMIKEVKSEFNDDDICSNLIVLYPAINFQVVSSTVEVVTMDPSGIIVQGDYQNCIASLNISNRIAGKAIIYDEPVFYRDGLGRTYDEFPLGQKSEKLQVKCDIQLIDESCQRYYLNIVKDLQLKAKLSMVSSVSGMHFITSFASIDDFVQLEMNDNSTILSVVKDKRISSSIIIDKGTSYVISSIADKMKVDKKVVEKYIKENGLEVNNIYSHIKDEYGKTSEDYFIAIEQNFSKFITSASIELKKLNVALTTPIVIYGSVTMCKGFDTFLQNKIERQVYVFESKVIGARGTKYINCLGAINVSSYNYISLSDKKDNYDTLGLNLRG